MKVILISFTRARSRLISAMFAVCMMTGTFTTQASVLGYVEHENVQGVVIDAMVSTDGGHVYAIEILTGSNRIQAFSRDAESGALQAFQTISPEDLGTDVSFFPNGLTVSPDGQDIYVIASFGVVSGDPPYGLSVMRFSRDPVSGQLSYADRVLTNVDFPGMGTPSDTITSSPDGLYLYLPGQLSAGSQIVVFQRAGNGVLNSVQQVTVDSNGEDLASLANTLRVSPDGKSAYLTGMTGQLYVFTRNITTGILTPLQTFKARFDTNEGVAGLAGAQDVVVSGDGRFVYVTGNIEGDPINSGDDQYSIVSFSRDTNDGSLTVIGATTNNTIANNVPDWDTLRGVNSLALGPEADQKFLYAGAEIFGSINVFRRDPSDGSLDWVGWLEHDRSAAHVVNLSDLQRISLSADGRHIYAALESGSGIGVFDTRADLWVVKTDSVDPVEISGSFTYTLTVTNNGPSDAQNVVVTDTLPAGVNYVSSSVNVARASCSETGGTVTCNLGDLPTTGAVIATLDVTAPGNSGDITNTATANADQLDTEPGNDSNSEGTTITDPSQVTADTGNTAGSLGIPGLLGLLSAWCLGCWRRSRYPTSET